MQKPIDFPPANNRRMNTNNMKYLCGGHAKNIPVYLFLLHTNNGSKNSATLLFGPVA